MGAINLEKINVLDAINFINAAWNIDVKTTTIANCFKHCKLRSEEGMPLEQEIGDVERIHALEEVISNLHYRNAINIEQILNYPSENKALMESPTNKKIIERVMGVPANDNQDLDDSNVLLHVSPKEAFLAVKTLKNYLFQHEKNIPLWSMLCKRLKMKLNLVHLQRRNN
ncbi:CENP-B homolog protein 2-like [Ricinus communis]|uniref:CENP-B homolog protein 2-like n=1 Tax=Ricinus communis TaxID=3988 RepID=UPI00077273BA|nr:CENP-B homolog protein 2-like [Ricinus communis]|eukprot:XP_015578348.1 CENP-B homolog protein 2-like [Ricinus communis]